MSLLPCRPAGRLPARRLPPPRRHARSHVQFGKAPDDEGARAPAALPLAAPRCSLRVSYPPQCLDSLQQRAWRSGICEVKEAWAFRRSTIACKKNNAIAGTATRRWSSDRGNVRIKREAKGFRLVRYRTDQLARGK